MRTAFLLVCLALFVEVALRGLTLLTALATVSLAVGALLLSRDEEPRS